MTPNDTALNLKVLGLSLMRIMLRFNDVFIAGISRDVNF